MWKMLRQFMIRRKFPHTKQCPHCSSTFRYLSYSGMSQLYPHFYCDCCSNVIRRKADFTAVMLSKPSEALAEELAATLPQCSCGGRYTLGANPKCPFCKKDIRHQLDHVSRLTDPYLIVIQGAKAKIEN